MDNFDTREGIDPLAKLLRREALRNRPMFSVRLHARLQAAVRQATPATQLATTHAFGTANSGRRPWAIAIASSLALLGVSMLSWPKPTLMLPAKLPPTAIAQRETSDSNPAGPSSSLEDEYESAVDTVGGMTSELEQWIMASLEENQWMGLDRDAQSALASVTLPLPFDVTAFITDSNQSGHQDREL